MPGLIQSAIDKPLDSTTLPDDTGKVALGGTTGYDATTRTVDPDQTVAGQLDKVLAKDSPLITKARAGSADQANSRGLINSSIAAGAGESAAIGAALPIAQQDAQTYGTAASDNMKAKNSASEFTAGAANTTSAANAAAVNAAQTVKLHGEIDTGLQQLRGTQATDLANIEANYKSLMQANSSAASLFNESMQQIGTILRDPSTSAEQKASAVSSINALLASSLAVAGGISNLDLGGLLDFTNGTPVPAGSTPGTPGAPPVVSPPASGAGGQPLQPPPNSGPDIPGG